MYCKYCTGGEFIIDTPFMDWRIVDNQIYVSLVNKEDVINTSMELNYCPKCGRKLGI